MLVCLLFHNYEFDCKYMSYVLNFQLYLWQDHINNPSVAVELKLCDKSLNSKEIL